jgi:hypothetical protein
MVSETTIPAPQLLCLVAGLFVGEGTLEQVHLFRLPKGRDRRIHGH